MRVLHYICDDCLVHYWIEEEGVTAADQSTVCPDCETTNLPKGEADILEVRSGNSSES